MENDLTAKRPKYWSELDSDEKIEKMRKEIKNLQRQLDANSRSTNDKLFCLERHSHSDGKVVVDLQSGIRELGILANCGNDKMIEKEANGEVFF